MRRAHHALKQINVVFDKTTGEPKLAHHVSADGFYNGRQVLVDNTDGQSTEDAAA